MFQSSGFFFFLAYFLSLVFKLRYIKIISQWEFEKHFWLSDINNNEK